MEAQRHASVALPAATTAPGDARRFTVETLRRWGADGVLDEAELIVSELVTNALRHASSPSRVVLSATDSCLRIEVADDGRGGADAQGYGLLGIADRVAAFGGKLEIESGGQGGTVLVARLPLSS